MNKQELWLSNEGFGSSLLIACIDDWGFNVTEWEPETLEITVREKYGNVSQDSIERALAAISVLKSNLFTQDVTAFCMTCSTLDFERSGNETFVPAGLDEVMWGLTEARLLLGALPDDEFSDEVAVYVGKLLEEEGLERPPDLLKFAVRKDTGLSADTLADLPDLSAMFEADQETTKETLDADAMDKLRRLLEQIESLRLTNTDLAEFKQVLNRMRGLQDA